MLGRTNRCRPTTEHELVLRAALLSGPAARVAYDSWRERIDFDRIDVGTQRLLPLVFRNLPLEADDPLLPRIKAVYRYAWLKNQVLAQRTAPLLDRLRESGVKTMLLKGAALLPFYGDDFGLRPMDDFDVLVPFDQARTAIDVLVAAGLRPTFLTPPEQVKQRYLDSVPGWGFEDGKGFEIDLHWHMLYASVARRADDDFWGSAVSSWFRNAPTTVPNQGDLLLHVLAHGACWSPIPPVRWVADAIMLLRWVGPVLDWDRFVTQAKRHRIRLPVADCLRYLQESFAAPVPPETIRALHAWRATPIERIEYDALTTAPDQRKALERSVHDYRRYVRRAVPPGVRVRPRVLVRYLKERWGLPRAWQVPLHAAFVGVGRPPRLRRMLGPILRKGRAAAGAENLYRLGDAIDFSDGGNATRYTEIGWSRPEASGTWTDAADARLRLSLEAPVQHELLLTVAAHAFVCDEHPRVVVEAWVNDTLLDEWEFRAELERSPGPRPERSTRIPAEVASRLGPLEIVLCIRHPMAPERVGRGNDTRALGVFVRRLRLSD